MNTLRNALTKLLNTGRHQFHCHGGTDLLAGLYPPILHNPSSWSEGLVSYLFAWASLLGASLVTSERGHMNIPIIVDRMPAGARKVFEVFGELIALPSPSSSLCTAACRSPSLPWGRPLLPWAWLWASSMLCSPLCGVLNMIYTVLNIVDICKSTADTKKGGGVSKWQFNPY